MNTVWYTTSVIEDVNNSHIGFWLLAIAAIFLAMIFSIIINDTINVDSHVVTSILWVLIMAYPFYESYIKEYPRPNNEPVIATLVHTYESEIRSGKQLISTEFVIYKVPEGDVSFRRVTGVVYAKEVVLYRQF